MKIKFKLLVKRLKLQATHPSKILANAEGQLEESARISPREWEDGRG